MCRLPKTAHCYCLRFTFDKKVKCEFHILQHLWLMWHVQRQRQYKSVFFFPHIMSNSRFSFFFHSLYLAKVVMLQLHNQWLYINIDELWYHLRNADENCKTSINPNCTLLQTNNKEYLRLEWMQGITVYVISLQ